MSPPARPRPVRRYRRLTLRVEVRLVSEADIRDEVATTLAAGGLFIATESPLPAGTPLRAHFCLPGETDPLQLEAHVAWSKSREAGNPAPGMGLEFSDAGARSELAARLEAWIRKTGYRAAEGAD